MSISAKRKLAVGAAGLAVLAGSGGAYAAAAGSSQTARKPAADRAAEQKAFLDDVAKRLNVTRDQLDAAVKGAAEARIDAAGTASAAGSRIPPVPICGGSASRARPTTSA